MRNRSKLLLTALSAAIVLGAMVSAASANRLALSNQSFRVTWNQLRFVSTFTADILCHVTIEGSFHSRTLSKSLEQLVGHVTRAIVDSTHCTNGSAWILTTNLPWHIRYNGFVASEGLPRIRGINLRLILAEFLVQQREPFGQMSACLYRSTAASPMRGIVNRNTTNGEITELTPEAAAIALASSSLSAGICPSSGRLENASTSVTLQGNSTRITVTLVQ